jgi:hypothetical protein
MKIKEALNILNPVSANPVDIKSAYKAFVRKYHPDVNPDGLELMKLGNLAWEVIMQNLDYIDREWAKVNGEKPEASIPEEIAEMFAKIRHFPNITAELCGIWIWVSGDTKPLAKEFKRLGFRWAFKKRMWSWHPSCYIKIGRSEWSMSEIRSTWGSQELETEELSAVRR